VVPACSDDISRPGMAARTRFAGTTFTEIFHRDIPALSALALTNSGIALGLRGARSNRGVPGGRGGGGSTGGTR